MERNLCTTGGVFPVIQQSSEGVRSVDEQGREAFRTYVAARSPALLRMAYLLTGSRADAEDLLQTALAKTYLAWDRIREREALDGYVRRVMANSHTSRWRRRKINEYATDDLPERGGQRDAMEDLALHDALWTALAGLPKRQRATVVLRYYEDLSEAETAAVLGISVGTVKSTTSRALAKLRDSSGLRDDPRGALPLDGVTA
jgi:RNA polymerase sigma-70 factor (sigma-E family)